MNIFDGLDLATLILLIFAVIVLAALAVVGAIEIAFALVIRRRRHLARYTARHHQR